MHAEGYTVYLEIALIICECRKHYTQFDDNSRFLRNIDLRSL